MPRRCSVRFLPVVVALMLSAAAGGCGSDALDDFDGLVSELRHDLHDADHDSDDWEDRLDDIDDAWDDFYDDLDDLLDDWLD